MLFLPGFMNNIVFGAFILDSKSYDIALTDHRAASVKHQVQSVDVHKEDYYK